MYELFDHTADLGLRVRADSLAALFAEAGHGFLAMLLDDPAMVAPRNEVTVEIAGSDREYLLFDWLDDLLRRFDEDRFLACQFDVSVNEAGLRATLRGETYDPVRHHLSRELKAITYHGLTVRQEPDGWLAEVIVDI